MLNEVVDILVGLGFEIQNTSFHHLRELANPTPSGFAKLLAAWDGLMGHKAQRESASHGG